MRELSKSDRIAQLRGWLTVLDALHPGNASATDEMKGAIAEMCIFFERLKRKAEAERIDEFAREGHKGLDPDGEDE